MKRKKKLLPPPKIGRNGVRARLLAMKINGYEETAQPQTWYGAAQALGMKITAQKCGRGLWTVWRIE